MMSEMEIRAKIKEYELQAQPWVDDDYTSVVNLFRAHIKGLSYAIGLDYNVSDGTCNGVINLLTESEIREKIRDIEEESKEWVAYDSVIRQFRAIIKGLKMALGEEYSIVDGK